MTNGDLTTDDTRLATDDIPSDDLPLAAFNERALQRMFRVMIVVSVLLVIPAFVRYGATAAIGFAAGAIVSCINFRALERSVTSLADRIVHSAGTDHPSTERGGRIVLRFLIRYALVGVAAYAIFRGSALCFRGFLCGLCLPVAAMMIEAGVEAWAAFRK